MPRVGIADLGSNTARLIVFSYEPGKWYRITDGIREPIRLGEGMARSGRLSEEAVRRAVAAVELFSDYARATALETLEILGTSAIRDAANRQEFVQAVAGLGLEVEVLTGSDEARLGVSAVANGFDLQDAWVIDLGGGSAQLSSMHGRRYESGEAYPLGAVRLTEGYLRSDPPTDEEVRALEAAVKKELSSLVDALGGARPLVAIGGTVRNLARMVQKQERYPLSMLHGYHLSRKGLEEVTERLLSLPQRERARLRGLNPDRADIILAGALVFRWILRRAGIDEMLISGYGVREGAFYRHFLEPPHLLEDPRRFSVLNRAERHSVAPGHVDQVRRLALRLFDELEPLHHLSAIDRELLEAAAILHDSGTNLDYYKHHKHGAYLLTIAPLNGFSHREQALIALLVRYHRKGLPRLADYESLAHPGDARRLLQLSVCLRMAESLERSRAGRIEDLSVEIGRKKALVGLQANEEPTLELWEARKHAPIFKQAFERRLELEVTAPVPP